MNNSLKQDKFMVYAFIFGIALFILVAFMANYYA